MSNFMAAIELGKLPWALLMFTMAYWKTAVVAVWGAGFAYILVKRMRAWYKDDARDAASGARSEDQVYQNMKVLARERRGPRVKELFTKGLFWILFWSFGVGRKVGKVLFYPVLAYLDRAQTEGLAEGRKGVKSKLPSGGSLGIRPGDIVVEPAEIIQRILTEGVNATKCMGCGFLVPLSHICPKPLVIESPKAPIRRATIVCDGCQETVPKDSPHPCVGREDGMVRCKCGATYKAEEDFEHVCPEEEDDASQAECKDCEREYDPTKEIHVAKFCRGCSEVHCKRHDCGVRV